MDLNGYNWEYTLFSDKSIWEVTGIFHEFAWEDVFWIANIPIYV